MLSLVTRLAVCLGGGLRSPSAFLVCIIMIYLFLLFIYFNNCSFVLVDMYICMHVCVYVCMYVCM